VTIDQKTTNSGGPDMMIPRTLRGVTGMCALAALIFILSLNLGGCSNDDSPTAPETPQAQAPALPQPADLQFDFSFFDAGSDLEKSGEGVHDNFVNAYLRAVVLGAMADLVLTPPVGAFAVALHTVPVAQDDGAWIWSYDWHGYRYPIRVALRGLPAGDHVQWEMRIGPGGVDPTAIWFEGRTSGDGSQGHWLFHDLDDPAQPVCGEVSWGDDETGHFLQFTSREPENGGSVLRFNEALAENMITFTPGDGAAVSFILWRNNGSGSLQVPDYNASEEACWDRWQEDMICQ